MKKPRFKKNESYLHKCAVEVLASWVDGKIEQPFYVEGSIVFVPDVTVYKDGILQCIYEVVNKHPVTAMKYGLIQYWSYRNVSEITVYEVSADYILDQLGKPLRIESKEAYIINPFEYEEIQDELITYIT